MIDEDVYIRKEDRPKYGERVLWYDPTDNDWSIGYMQGGEDGDEVFLEDYRTPYSIATFSRWRHLDSNG